MTDYSGIYDSIAVNLRRGTDNGGRIVELAQEMVANTTALNKQSDEFVRLIVLIAPLLMPDAYEQFTECIKSMAQMVDLHMECLMRFKALFISQLKIEKEVYGQFAELAKREIVNSPA